MLSCGTMHCNWSCLCVCAFVCGGHCGSVTTITRNACINLHQTGYVGEGSDHLQLIKFWFSCASVKGVCGGAKTFGSTLLQAVRSVCILSERFFHFNLKHLIYNCNVYFGNQTSQSVWFQSLAFRQCEVFQSNQQYSSLFEALLICISDNWFLLIMLQNRLLQLVRP